MASYVVARVKHTQPVGYFVLSRTGSHTWSLDKTRAYRFASASAAIHYAGYTIDGDSVVILSDDRAPSSDNYGTSWRLPRTVAPSPVELPYVPLEQWRMTTAQRVTLSIGVAMFALMAVALVAGW